MGGVEWGGVLTKVVVPAILAPVVAALVAGVGTKIVYRITASVKEDERERGFRFGQIGTASLISLAHGTNDAQKTMGVIFLALVAHGTITAETEMPFWVKFTCAVAIALGTYLGGWRIIRTLGKGLVEIAAPQGLAAEASSAAIILTSSHLGLPLSTTHVATGSILGTGIGRKGAEVRWGVAGRIGRSLADHIAVGAAVVGAICWALAHLVGGLAGVLVVFAALIAFAIFMYIRSRKEPVDAANVTAEWDENSDAAIAEIPAAEPTPSTEATRNS